jgi:hypothetical protein
VPDRCGIPNARLDRQAGRIAYARSRSSHVQGLAYFHDDNTLM